MRKEMVYSFLTSLIGYICNLFMRILEKFMCLALEHHNDEAINPETRDLFPLIAKYAIKHHRKCYNAEICASSQN